VRIITAIAEAESTVRGVPCYVEARGDGHLTYKRNGREYGYSVSVLQVRILEGREHCDVYNLEVNVSCAYEIWKAQGYSAWTMYNNNEYLKYL
jgi:hypothetical protein